LIEAGLGLLLPGFQSSGSPRRTAGYSYGATWGPAPAGLAPASHAASFAAFLSQACLTQCQPLPLRWPRARTPLGGVGTRSLPSLGEGRECVGVVDRSTFGHCTQSSGRSIPSPPRAPQKARRNASPPKSSLNALLPRPEKSSSMACSVAVLTVSRFG